jgi:hypothetical protein
MANGVGKQRFSSFPCMKVQRIKNLVVFLGIHIQKVYFMKCMIPLIKRHDDYCWVGIEIGSKPLSLLKMII